MKTTNQNGKFFTPIAFNQDEKARIAAHARRMSAYLRANGNVSNMTERDRAAFGGLTTAQLHAAMNGSVIGQGRSKVANTHDHDRRDNNLFAQAV